MRRTFGLLLAAGLLSLVMPAQARAQASYGYDSWYYNLPQAVNYYNGTYPGVYTDPSTAAFLNGSAAQMRPITPYMQPPYANYATGDPLRQAAGATAAPGQARAAAPAPVRTQPAPAVRRGIFGRVRTRR